VWYAPPMTEPKTENLKVPVTPTIRTELQAIADRHDVSLAHVVRLAIRRYLQEEK
jgi:hypothetical protein